MTKTTLGGVLRSMEVRIGSSLEARGQVLEDNTVLVNSRYLRTSRT